MPDVIAHDNDVIGAEPTLPASAYNVARGARYTKLTISESQVVKFSTKYNVFGVKGDNITVSLTPDAEGDGVYNTSDGDGSILIAHYSNCDTLYLTGTGDVIIWAGNNPADCPFKKTGKGGGATYIGETTTAIEEDSDVNPIVIDNQEVTAKAGDVVKYIHTYYSFNGSVWSEFIDTSYLITGMIEDEVIIGELIPVYPTKMYVFGAGKFGLTLGGQGESVGIDWGDGTYETVTVNGSQVTYEHTYADEVSCIITLYVSGGSITITSDQVIDPVKVTEIEFGTDIYQFQELLSSKSTLQSVRFKNPDTLLGDIFPSFQNCTELAIVHLPTRLKTIPGYTFENCTPEFNDIDIPATVTRIGNYAFKGCSGLSFINLYATTPPVLGTGAFEGCENLYAINVPAESVDTYKAAPRWSDYADIIYAIS